MPWMRCTGPSKGPRPFRISRLAAPPKGWRRDVETDLLRLFEFVNFLGSIDTARSLKDTQDVIWGVML